MIHFIDLKKQQEKIRKNIDKRISKVLNHGKYIMGPEVFELEEKLAEYVGSKYCVSCSSGTDALLISLMALGVGRGDAVITTTYSYFATAEVICFLGAEPVFVDIYPETFNMDPKYLEEAIKNAKNKNLIPKGLIAVDLFGLPARYRIIEKIAAENNLFVLEDAAQSFGASIKMKKTCSFGHVAATSFFPAKPLGCYGDGGAIFTDDEHLAEKLKSIRVHGAGKNKYENIRIGLNGRLDTIQAAILLEKLSLFDHELTLRQKVAEYYLDNINDKLTKPYIPKNYKSSWAQFSLLAESAYKRRKLIEKLILNNIPHMVYYEKPMHLQPAMESFGYEEGSHPISEGISSLIFSIPMHPYLTKEMQDFIVSKINE